MTPRRAAAALLILLGISCASPGSQPGEALPSATSALSLGGQRVLVLPVQAVTGAVSQADRATAELLWALSERDPRVTWVAPAELERSLRRSPGFAADPRLLPADPLVHHGERRVVDPLAGEIRRYAALTDTRLVLLPQELRFTPAPSAGGRVTLRATLLDARTGDVVWWGAGHADAENGVDGQSLGTAAAALARGLLAVSEADGGG